MSFQKSNKAILVEYKFLKEENDSVVDLYNKGLTDLTYYLSDLKGQLSNKVEGQVEKFEEQFFKKPKDSEEIIKELEKVEETQDVSKTIKKEQWAKKLYREIVLLTHPDKTAAIPIPKIANKLLGYYNIAVDAYGNNIYEDLLYIGNELDLDLPDDKVIEYIKPKIKILKEDIQKKMNLFPYQWMILDEDKRSIILQNYLKSIGYVFEKKEIDELIERVKRIKRKPGTRPVNYLRQRCNLT